MVNFYKKLNFLITGIFVVSGFLFFITQVDAATSTVRGKAYWGNYGYISFNCEDDVIGNTFNEVGNLSGKDRYIAPPADAAFHFYAPPCEAFDHGVYINNVSNLSGSAWNPSVGFIDFFYDGVNDPPGGFGFNANCDSVCNKSTNCIACYSEDDQNVYGWGRISATNEWIRLDSTSTLPTKIQWGISDPIWPGHNIEAGDFLGTAKMDGSSPRGDISFNCESENYPGAGTCATRSYRVYIKNLRLGKLSAPNWSYSSACNNTALNAVLKWSKFSGIQTAYEVLVREDNNISTSTGFTCWSGKVNDSGATQYIVSNSNSDCGGRLKYDTNYFWWVRAYDEEDKPTDWYQYNTNSIASNGGDPDVDPLTFTTYKHEFPNPFFTWSPLAITIGTSTEFTSAGSEFYNSSQTVQSCAPGLCSYEWSAVGNNILISATTSATTSIEFWNLDNNTTVSLRVQDNDSYYCSISSGALTINFGLPLWHEVKAE